MRELLSPQNTDYLERAREVERLLLFHAHLLPLANNFVSFPLLYACTETALFVPVPEMRLIACLSLAKPP